MQQLRLFYFDSIHEFVRITSSKPDPINLEIYNGQRANNRMATLKSKATSYRAFDCKAFIFGKILPDFSGL